MKAALLAAQDDPGNSAKNPVYVGPGVYVFPGEGPNGSGYKEPLVLKGKSQTTTLKIAACNPNDRPVFDGNQPWTSTYVNDTTRVADGSEWPTVADEKDSYGLLSLGYFDDEESDCGYDDSETCAGFEFDGIDFRNAQITWTSGTGAGAIVGGVKLAVSNAAFTRLKGPTGALVALYATSLTDVSVRQCYGTANDTNNAGAMYVENPVTMKNLAVEYNGSASNAGGARLSIDFIDGDSVTLDSASFTSNAPTGLVSDNDNGGKSVICSGTTKSCGNPANATATGASNCGGSATYDTTCGNTVCVGGAKTTGTPGSGACT